MSTTTPIPDEQPQDGAPPTLADYAAALKTRAALRQALASAVDEKDLAFAARELFEHQRALDKMINALEAAAGGLVDDLLADFILEVEARSGELTQDDLEDTNGRWRACTTEEDREAGQRVWQAYRVGAEAHTEVTRLSTGWFIESPGRPFSLDYARELVQLMEKVERQDVLDPRVRTEKDDTELRPVFAPDPAPAEVTLLVEVRDLLKELVNLQIAGRVSGPLSAAVLAGVGSVPRPVPQQSVVNHEFSDFVDFHADITRGARPAELPLLGEELAQIRDRVFGPGSAHHEETLTGLDGFRARLVLAMLALHHLERVRENGRVFVLGPNAPAARSVVKMAAEIASAVPSLGGWAYQDYGLGRLKGLGRGSIVAVNAGARRGGASSVEGEIPTLILAPWLRTEEHERALRVLQAKAAKTSSRWVVPTVRVEAKED